MSSRLLRIVLPVLLLGAGVAAFLGLKATRPQGQPVVAEERAWIVRVETVSPQTLRPSVVLYGRVDSPRLSELRAAVTADVVDVPARAGSVVAAGDLLVRLDASDLVLERDQRQAEVDDIRAQVEAERLRFAADTHSLENERLVLDLAERAVARASELASSSAGSRSQLDDVRQAAARQRMAVAEREYAVSSHPARMAQLAARLARAEALLRRAQLDESRTRVVAPFDGRVTAVEVSTGDRVRAGDLMLALYDLGALEIRAQIPIRLIARLADALSGGNLPAARADLDGLALPADLDRLGGMVERGSGGVDAYFRIAAEHGERLQVGRTLALVMELPPERDVVALPLEALYGTDRVFALEGERMRELAVVRVGELRTEDGQTRVLVRGAALHPGIRIVTTQLPNAIDGLRVRAIGAAAEGGG